MRGKKIFAILSLIAMFVGVLGNGKVVNASEETESTKPVFLAAVPKEEQYLFTTAFYAKDVKGSGEAYLITSAVIAEHFQSGYDVQLVNSDEIVNVREASVDASGQLSYLSIGNIEKYIPFNMTEGYLGGEAVIAAIVQDENDNFVMDLLELDMSSFQEKDGIYTGDVEMPVDFLKGAPVLNPQTMEVWGIVTTDSTNILKIIDINSLEFPGEEKEPGEKKTEEKKTEEKKTEEKKLDQKTKAKIIGIVIGAVIAFFVISMKKRTPEKKEMTSGYREGTIALSPNIEPEMTGRGMTELGREIQERTEMIEPQIIEEVRPLYQIRGISGTLEGKIFGVGTTVYIGRSPRCQVMYPANAAGISGEHCKLEPEDGGIVLRDLQSTYGTFYNGSQMQPQLDYHLKAGDFFYLGEKTQMFRVEVIGEHRQEFTPVVKSVVEPKAGIFYHADAEGRLAFGRSANAQVKFEESNTLISTRHCILYKNNEGLFLMDLGSTNGTFLSDERRLQPNVPYRISRGSAFFLATPKYTFVITEE